MNSDERWMQLALAQAVVARDAGEVPVGAVVIKDDEIIGEGWNQPLCSKDPTAHAEIVALRDAANRLGNYRLTGASLYVTIEPCTMCVGAMLHARITRMVFGALEPKAGAIQSHLGLLDQDHFNHRIEYRGGVFAEECAAMMWAFFQSRR